MFFFCNTSKWGRKSVVVAVLVVIRAWPSLPIVCVCIILKKKSLFADATVNPEYISFNAYPRILYQFPVISSYIWSTTFILLWFNETSKSLISYDSFVSGKVCKIVFHCEEEKYKSALDTRSRVQCQRPAVKYYFHILCRFRLNPCD